MVNLNYPKQLEYYVSEFDEFFKISSSYLLELEHRNAQIEKAIHAQILVADDSKLENDLEINGYYADKITKKKKLFYFYDKKSAAVYDRATDIFQDTATIFGSCLFHIDVNEIVGIETYKIIYNPEQWKFPIDKDNLNIEKINSEIRDAFDSQPEDQVLQDMYAEYSEIERPHEYLDIKEINISELIQNYFDRCMEMKNVLNDKFQYNIG